MNIFKKLGWFFKQERKRYIIGITFLALTSLANLIPPRVLGLMADQLDQGHISWGQYGMLILAVLAAAFVLYILRYFFIDINCVIDHFVKGLSIFFSLTKGLQHLDA